MAWSKAALRSAVRAIRSEQILAAEDPPRLHHLLAWLPTRAGVVATYSSTAHEPDTVALIDEFVLRGWEVRLPVLRREPNWAQFAGWDTMTPSWQGILEPTTARLSAASLRDADLIIVPCLQVDGEGYRLGVGGGWYDRALPHRRTGSVALAWSRATETVPSVPRETHDVPVDGWVSELGIGWAGGVARSLVANPA